MNWEVSREEAFIFFADLVSADIPESYKFIQLEYINVKEGSKIYKALQQLVYLDKIQNNAIDIYPQKDMNRGEITALSSAILWLNITPDDALALTTFKDLSGIGSLYINQKEGTGIQIKSSLVGQNSWLTKKEQLFFDVYETLQNSHYDRDNFSEEELLNSAIQGLAEWANDTYTSYFPAEDSTKFFENLDGEYEGIGAYVEMPIPGELNIVSPISGWPAESVWIEWGDRVISVDWKEVTSENSLEEVISWIKGPSNTVVKITILRGEETLNFSVTRAKITLKDVEYKKLDTKTSYIQIKNFGEQVAKDLKEILTTISEDNSTKKIIIDLRNNPGWYLDQVGNILWYFIPEWETTAIVSYGAKENIFLSKGNTVINLNEYKLIFLQNSGTASASEIMIGSLKDYFPQSIIVWEQSFGKGSVQSLKSYYDGSTLKYTSAKWYTGWSRTGIDGIGITPDIKIELNRNRLENFKKDNQLEAALDL